MPCTYQYGTSRLQFVVGDPTSVVTDLPGNQYELPNVGGTQLLFMINSVVQDSVEVYFAGTLMPRSRLDVASYTVEYTQMQTLITFYFGVGQGVEAGQLFVIRLNTIQ